ncbi:hypothetical protein GC176_04420 [bacterium]|nr:hypothetical protein [bacterium]
MLRLTVVAVCLLATVATARADEHDLEAINEAPKGLSPAIMKLVNPEGFRITGKDGALADLWLLKDLAVEPGFKSSLSKLYAFQPGQLIGALRIAEGAEYTDFRGQEMKAGTYTLRYGLQPMDGNHAGTSETSDFLLALPAAVDTKPEGIASKEELAKESAQAAGSTHPAIFSLVDPKRASRKAKLEFDDFNEHWILSFTGEAKEGDTSVKLKVRLIVIGRSEG